MSILEMFIDTELDGDIHKVLSTFQGEIDGKFLHLILSDKNIYLVSPKGISDKPYIIKEKIAKNKVDRLDVIGDRILKIVLRNGEQHIFNTNMSAKRVSDIIQNQLDEKGDEE